MHERLLNDELRLFRDTFRDWLKREVTPHYEKWEHDGGCPREIYRKAGEQGFLLLNQPSTFGGLDLDFRFSAVLIEEIALAGANGLAFWLHSDIIAPYVEHFGNDAQKKFWLPKMASGESIAAIAMSEPGTGSDLQAMQMTAVREGDDWVLNGTKTFISNGINSDVVIVAAKTPAETAAKAPATAKLKYTPLTLFIVEKSRKGLSVGRKLEKMGLKAQDTAELFFSDCRVPNANVLGEVGQGFLYLTKSLGRERLCMAIHSIAAARYALALTLDYIDSRHAFGKKISEFQNTRFKLADIASEIEVTQAFLDQCVLDLNENRDLTMNAAVAKLKATEVLSRVTDECLQLFGGWGYMAEYPISRAYADARVWRIFGGTSEIMREIIARKVLE